MPAKLLTAKGVVSLKDLAEEAWKERDAQAHNVTTQDIGEIVTAIAVAP